MKTPEFIKSDNLILHLILIAIIAAVVWGLTCGLWSLGGAVEGYYVSAAKEIIANGGSIFSGSSQTMGQQPPLVFWLFALTLKIAGDICSLAPRLVSAIFAFITLACTYYCGRRLISPRAGLYSAFILATCPVFMAAAVKVAPNMVFAGLITISITAVITRQPHERAGIIRAVVIWLGLIAAFLAMGLMAPIMILLFIILFILAQGKEIRNEIKAIWLFSGILAGVVIMAVWLVLEYHFTGNTFIKNELSRYGTLFNTGLDLSHWWYYFAKAGHILGIWAIGLVIAVLMLLVHKVKFIAKWYLWLFWFAPGFALLCLIPEKNTDFILPLLPPLALFIGYYLSTLAASPLNGKICGVIAQIIGKLLLLAGIVACTLALICFVQLEFAWQQAFYIDKQGIIIAFVLGLILVFIGSHNYKTSFGALFGAIVLALLIGNIGLNAVVCPALDVTTSSRYFSQNLQNMYPEMADAGLAATTDASAPQIHIYNNYPIISVNYNSGMFGNATAAALPNFILMTEQEYADLAVKPELGGFATAFWDNIGGETDVILLKRITDKVVAPTAPMPAIYMVPKPLLLAISAELNTQSSTVEHITSGPSTIEDEGSLKEVFGPGTTVPVTENQAETPVDPVAAPDGTDETATPDNAPTNQDPANTATPAEQTTPPEVTTTDATPPDGQTLPVDSAEPAATEHAAEETAMPNNTDIAPAATEAETPSPAVTQPNETAAVPEPPVTEPETTDATTAPAINDAAAVAPANNEPEQAVETPPATDEVTPVENPTNPATSRRSFSLVSMAYANENALPQPLNAEPQATETLTETSADNAVADVSATATTPTETETPAAEVTEEATEPLPKSTPLVPEMQPTASEPPAIALNANKCVLSQGFAVINNAVTPYYSNCAGRNAALLDIATYQPNLARFYSVNLQNGFGGNAYALHWFKTQAGKYKANYNMLVINNIASTPTVAWPYTTAFERWAMQQLNNAVNPQAVFFTGLDPVGAAPQAVLEATGLKSQNVLGTAAEKIQLNFGLHQTVLNLEYTDGSTLEVELGQ